MSNRRRDGIRITAGRHVLKRIPVNGGTNRTAAGVRRTADRTKVLKRGRKDPADRKTKDPRLNARETQVARLVTMAYETLPTDIIVEGLTVPGGGTFGLDIAVHMAEFEPLFAEILLDQLDETGFVEFNNVREQVVRHLRNVGKAVETELPSQFAAKQIFGQASPTALKWAQNESAQLMAKTMTGEQVKAVRQVIGAAFSDGLTSSQTSSKLIQILQEIPGPPIAGMAPFANSIKGLTEPYAMAVYHRAEKLADAGKDLVEVIADADKYGAKLRRSRGKMIARTEIMRANNQGQQESYNQMAASGLLQSSAKKMWVTGRFDVCDICSPMNGVMVGIKENFHIGYQGNPPAHPNCRCDTELVPNTKDYALPESLGTGLPGSPLQIKFDPLTKPGGIPKKIKFPSAPKITPAPKPPPSPPLAPASSVDEIEFISDMNVPTPTVGKWNTPGGESQPLDWFINKTDDTGGWNSSVPAGSKIDVTVKDTVWPQKWGGVAGDQKTINFGLKVSDDALTAAGKQVHNLDEADLKHFTNPLHLPGTLDDELVSIYHDTFTSWTDDVLEVFDEMNQLEWSNDQQELLNLLSDMTDDVRKNVAKVNSRITQIQESYPHPAGIEWTKLAPSDVEFLLDTAAMKHKVNDQTAQLINMLLNTSKNDDIWKQIGLPNQIWSDQSGMQLLRLDLQDAIKAKKLKNAQLIDFANTMNVIDDVGNEALILAYGEKMGIIGNEKKMLQYKYGKLMSPNPDKSVFWKGDLWPELLPGGKLVDESNWAYEHLFAASKPGYGAPKLIGIKPKPKSMINAEGKADLTPRVKVPAKKPPAKKQPTAKKPAAKKPTAKKPPVKKKPAKKQPAKKPKKQTPDDIPQGKVNSMASQPFDSQDLPSGFDPDRLIEDKALTKKLSGQNPKKVFLDPDEGQQWIFKPQDRWQAELESATSSLQGRLGISGPDVFVVELDGQIGSLHKVLGKTLDDTRAIFGDKKFDATKLSAAQLEQMQQNYLFDYLISNYDAHSENFLRLRQAVDSEMLPIGIDKGQAFKHFGKKGEADALLDWMFNPNKNTPSKMPYGQMFEQYAKGDIPGLQFLEDSKKLRDTIATAKYLADSGKLDEILRPFAEAAIQAGKLQAKNADEFIATITQRFADIDKKWLDLEDALIQTEGGKSRLLMAGQKEKLADLDLLDKSEFNRMPVRSASAKFNKRTDNLSRSEKAALERYTGSWYGPANKSLRVSRGSRTALNRTLDDGSITTLRHMDEAFDSHGPIGENITVLRGTDKLADQLGNIIDDPPTQLIGGVFQDHGFVSTSVGDTAAFAGKYRLELDIPAEVRGVYVKKLSSHSGENEMILERGLNFVVTDVEKGFNMWTIKAQAIPRGLRTDILPDADIVDLS